MKIQYLSDLHLDFYSKNLLKINHYIPRFIDTSSDVLIIAGDISHYNIQIVNFLKECKKYIPLVLFCTGNHEFYNVSKTQRYKYLNTYSKVNELKEMVSDLDGIHFLDGDIVEYNGIKIGGAMGWYDNSYYYKLTQGMYSESLLSFWKNNLNDFHRIPSLKDPMDIFNIEIQKIKKVLEQKPDIMISHYCPISEGIVFKGKYKTDRTSGFYCFDGLHLIPESVKYWIHGHIHSTHEFEIYNTKYIRNPAGYPDDMDADYKIKNIVIKDRDELLRS